MPANRDLLRERLGALGLAPHREEEILHELSEHLEDHAAEIEARGVTREEALREALNDVSDWSAVRHEIVCAEVGEEYMNYRTKTFWLPGFVALVISSGLLALLQFAGVAPRFFWLTGQMGSGGPFIPFYIGWLVTLPVVGAMAAFWSWRAGGRAFQRLIAALAPSLAMLGFLLTAPVISLFFFLSPYFVKPQPLHIHFSLKLALIAFLTYLVSWVLLPAVGLLIGALPFLRRPQAQA